MSGRPEVRAERTIRGLERLRTRREVHVLAIYFGAAWIIYEAMAVTADTFHLPSIVSQITFGLLLFGAVLSIPLSRWYQLTAQAVDESDTGSPGDVVGVPDVIEPTLRSFHRRVGRGSILTAGAASLVGFSLLFFFLWNAWAETRGSELNDPRLGVAVFPFRTAGLESTGLGEGIGDLLVVTLDGTPGIRMIDPTSLWSKLRSERGAEAVAPETEEAIRLARAAGAHRFVVGTVLASGSSLEVSARVYDAEFGDQLATLHAAANGDAVGTAVDRLAIDLVSAVWEREQLPTVPRVERYATSNADALKAYLQAMSLKRQAKFVEAQEAIEEAVRLDTTFALALMEQFNILSVVKFQNAEPFIGLRPIIEQAMRHRDRLTPRNRLRVEAARALDDTDGTRAAFLLERILSIDSLDVDAHHTLGFTYFRDGWQLGKGLDQIVRVYDGVLELDPSSVRARGIRATLAMWEDDPESTELQVAELTALDTLGALSRGVVRSFQALKASDAERAGVLRGLAAEASPTVFTIIRNLRTVRPDVAEGFLQELIVDSLPASHQRIGAGALLQLWFAEGRLSSADSALQAGGFEGIRSWINALFITTSLASVGSDTYARRAAAELSAYVPADSLLFFFETRPAWLIGWAVGAYTATFGDSATAMSYRDAIGTLPGGGTPLDYRASLQADIDARLAVRRGDLETAERLARVAYEQWGIHSAYFQDFHPEVAMRFHLADILRAEGKTTEAERYYRSLSPPHTWYGFYTARSALELAEMEEGRGNAEEAQRFYVSAARLWERGDPEIVEGWLRRSRSGIARLRGE